MISKDAPYSEVNIMKKYVLSICLFCLLIGTHIHAAPQKNAVTTVSAMGVNSQGAPTTVNNVKVSNGSGGAVSKAGKRVVGIISVATMAFHSILFGFTGVTFYNQLIILNNEFTLFYSLLFMTNLAGVITSYNAVTSGNIRNRLLMIVSTYTIASMLNNLPS